MAMTALRGTVISMNDIALKTIALRTIRSALQAGLAVLVGTGTGMISVDALQTAGVAALVALITALQNTLEQVEISRSGQLSIRSESAPEGSAPDAPRPVSVV
jgi:hypothetical protein